MSTWQPWLTIRIRQRHRVTARSFGRRSSESRPLRSPMRRSGSPGRGSRARCAESGQRSPDRCRTIGTSLNDRKARCLLPSSPSASWSIPWVTAAERHGVATVGPLDLLVFGFDAPRLLAPEVKRQLNLLRRHDLLRVLDVLYVSKDEQGVFSVGQGGDDLNPRAALAESALWELFDGGDPTICRPSRSSSRARVKSGSTSTRSRASGASSSRARAPCSSWWS